jgi:hypothetical protein
MAKLVLQQPICPWCGHHPLPMNDWNAWEVLMWHLARPEKGPACIPHENAGRFFWASRTAKDSRRTWACVCGRIYLPGPKRNALDRIVKHVSHGKCAVFNELTVLYLMQHK